MPTQRLSQLLAALLLLSTCGCSFLAPAPTPTLLPSATATATATATPTPTPTLTPTATPIRTPPALPGSFTTGIMNPLDKPYTYIPETCRYLRLKWDPNNSAPGTVVMVIMYHSITDDPPPYESTQIYYQYHRETMQKAADLGFETINPAQLLDFLENNARIPPRSLLLISDDRHQAEFFEDHFIPVFQEYGWTSVTQAWISTPLSPVEWFEPLRNLIEQGYLDEQAHGVTIFPIESYTSEETIRTELGGSITFIQQHFGVTPIAYIWPGGGFTQRSVEIARELGYKLGFTINPRGPIMFNWVPGSDVKDPMRPYYIPEGPVNDPLMVLPRYWSTDADTHLDEVTAIGDAAAAQAAANRDTELLYYDIVCKDQYGPIPTP